MGKNRGRKLLLLFSAITLYTTTALAYSISGQDGFLGAVFGEFVNFQNQWELLASVAAFFLIWLFGYMFQALIIKTGIGRMPGDTGDELEKMLLGSGGNFHGAKKRNLLIWITLLEVLALGRLLPALISDVRGLILAGTTTVYLFVFIGGIAVLAIVAMRGGNILGGGLRSGAEEIAGSQTAKDLGNAAKSGMQKAKEKWEGLKERFDKNRHIEDSAIEFAKTVNDNASYLGWKYCVQCARNPNRRGLKKASEHGVSCADCGADFTT